MASALLLLHTLPKAFRVYRRLAHVKGPWLAQFSDAWLLGAIYRQRATTSSMQSIRNMARIDRWQTPELLADAINLGNLSRIGPNTLLTAM